MTKPWQPSGIVALTTDFGLVDPYVGMMKGVILARMPDARIVDVTHGVPPQDVRAGAFFLRAARAYFPTGTVHVAVVDPGVGSARRLLVAHDDGQCFLGPDNGLLTQALGPSAACFELDAARFALPDRSSTFHGRDILAPAAAAIAGGLPPEEAGSRSVSDPVRLDPARTRASKVSAQGEPAADGDPLVIETEVVVVDHFGNVVLAILGADLPRPHARWCVEHREQRIGFQRTYADVERGKALALVDSYGAVELSVRDGHAARVLGLSPGDRVTLRRQP